MIEVNIIGTGNVAWHLSRALASENDIVIMQIAGRSETTLSEFKKFTQETVLIDNLVPAEVNIIAVSDDAIADVASSLPFDDALIVHTSGFTEMEKLLDVSLSRKRNKENRIGVFYPLQSFSKDDPAIDFKEIPVLIEACDEKDEKTLQTLASTISNRVEIVNSAQRRQIHLAAVFANNFTNHLFTIAQEICNKNGASFDLLNELIKKTANKAIENGPLKSQTGPAKRGDQKVIDIQQELLINTDHKNIYNSITDALKTTYGKKL